MGNETKRYFLEVFDETVPIFVQNRRINQYINYFENGDWDDTGSDFPTILFVCESSRLQKQLQKRIVKNLDGISEDEIVVYTTTKERLKDIPTNTIIWQEAIKTERLLSLEDI